mgnify:CR=1 FL=1
MDTINPWLDVDELNRLANALIQPVQKKKADPARNFASKSLAKASEQAKRAGIVTPAATAAPSEVRQADLPELGTWLTDNARCEGLCVVDRDGDVYHSAMPNKEWTNLTVSAATKGQRLEEGKSPSVRMKVAAGLFLQFITIGTDRGPLLVGLLTRNLLRESQLTEFSDLVGKISGADQVEKR